MEVVKQNQAQVLQLKGTLSELQTDINGIDKKDERINELKDRLFDDLSSHDTQMGNKNMKSSWKGKLKPQ